VLLLALSCAAQVAFLASLGVWLSLGCRNTLWAQLSMALAVMVTFGASWAVLVTGGTPVLAGGVRPDWLTNFHEVGLNPLGAWWVLGFSWDQFAALRAGRDELFQARLQAALAGTFLFAAAAAVLWLAACWRFRAEQAR
jgi:hypothetical protein